MAKHHPDLIMCRKQPGIAIGRLCEKCDGKCVICDSYVRPCTLVRVCDECNYGSFQGRCVICGGVGISDAYYCKECTQQEKDRDGCPKIVNLGSAKTDLFYERKKYGFKKRWSFNIWFNMFSAVTPYFILILVLALLHMPALFATLVLPILRSLYGPFTVLIWYSWLYKLVTTLIRYSYCRTKLKNEILIMMIRNIFRMRRTKKNLAFSSIVLACIWLLVDDNHACVCRRPYEIELYMLLFVFIAKVLFFFLLLFVLMLTSSIEEFFLIEQQKKRREKKENLCVSMPSSNCRNIQRWHKLFRRKVKIIQISLLQFKWTGYLSK